MNDSPTSQLPADYSIPGMRIRVCGPDEPWALVVHSAEKKSWGVYPEDLASLTLPPDRVRTTIVYQGRPYRIHLEERTPTGWAYRMKPWPENEIYWADVVELSPDAHFQDAVERGAFRRFARRTAGSLYWDFLVGWLPARIQNQLADRWRFGPDDASRRNAILEFYFCFALAAVSFPMGRIDWAVLFLLLATEGVARWVHAWGMDQPIGLIVVELADRLVLLVPRLFRSRPRK